MFASAVILILGGLLLLGIDSPERAGVEHVERVESPALDEAPQAIDEAATEQGGAREEAAKATEKPLAKEPVAKEPVAKEPAAGEEAETASAQGAAEVAEQEKASEPKEAAKPAPPPEEVAPEPATTDLYLTVPKMGRYNDYVANTDDPAIMDQGAVKLPSTGFPWQDNANTYIAAHVLGYSGTGSLYQFAELPNMTYGDKIYLTDANGTTYVYEVTEVMTVTPYDNWVTYPVPGRDMVTLQTCVNPPAYDQRLVVRADRVDVDVA